jgi:pimeloyl-ACP methyl ester carboxylesterase
VVGADDERFRALAGAAVAASPALTVDVIAGSGHDPTLEAPLALANVIARTARRLGAAGS